MDFLGLRNLDVIEDALDIIERSTGERPDMTTLPLDDAKTYEMLAARRLGRRVPVRVRGHARGAQEGRARRSSTTSSRSTRCTARARWTRSRPTRGASATPTSVTIPDERLEPIIGPTYGRDPVPGAGHADLQGDRGLLAAPRPTTCARRSARRTARRWPSSSRSSARAAARRARAAQVIDWLWTTNEKSADYSFNQSPRRLLRAHRLPHRLAEGELPRRVHGGADLLRHGHEGQGPVLRRPGARRWASRSCRPTSTSPTTSSSSSTGNIRFGLDAVKGVGYAAVEAIKARARGGRDFESLWDFCARVDAAR